jgi:hypothetical protein
MVNGRIARMMPAAELAQRPRPAAAPARRRPPRPMIPRRASRHRPPSRRRRTTPRRGLPHRPPRRRRGDLRRLRLAHGILGAEPLGSHRRRARPQRPRRAAPRRLGRAAETGKLFDIPLAERYGRTALVAGTFDTKGRELVYLRDQLRAVGVRTRTVDLSTSGKPSSADVPPQQVAGAHPRGASGVFNGDRGTRGGGDGGRLRALDRPRSGTSAASSPPAARAAPRSRPRACGAAGRRAQADDLDHRRLGRRRPLCRPVRHPAMLHVGRRRAGPQPPSPSEVLVERRACASPAWSARTPSCRRRAAASPSTKPRHRLTMFGVTTPCVQQV